MSLACHRVIRSIAYQRKLLNNYDFLNSKAFRNSSSLISNLPSHLAQSKNLVYSSAPNNFSVLNDAKLKEARGHVESILNESKYFEKVFNKILESNQEASESSSLYVVKRKSPNQNLNTRENLKKKLQFKLARIIMCLRKLTNVCSKNVLNESSQLRLLTETILMHMKENKDVADNDEQLDVEFEIDGVALDDLNEFNFMNMYDEDTELDNEEDDETDDPFINVSVDLKDFKRFYVYNYVLEEFGKALDEKSVVDFTEDIVESIERELEQNVNDLRKDFLLIDRYVKELRVVIAKEWLTKNDEKIFQNKNDRRLLSVNYVEENDEK